MQGKPYEEIRTAKKGLRRVRPALHLAKTLGPLLGPGALVFQTLSADRPRQDAMSLRGGLQTVLCGLFEARRGEAGGQQMPLIEEYLATIGRLVSLQHVVRCDFAGDHDPVAAL